MKTINGGKTGFTAAIDDAYRSNAHNPTVRYSHARGFHVESKLTPADEDVIWNEEAFYHANSGDRSLRPSDYAEIRNDILSAQ